jgi:diguanylate cyclase (GGDEF)-like protein
MVYRAVLGEQARQDPLTGAALRRVLDARLESSFRRRHEEGGSVAVVLCDLDFFKRINDTFGHAAGDRALKAVARTLTDGIREEDLCARYGGEEFALILEDLSGDRVLEIADQIRRSIEDLAVPVESPTEAGEGEDTKTLPLSVSAGIAVYPEVHCQQAEELLELADIALYEAKRLGRNCCLIYRGGGRYQDARGRVIETAEPAGLSAPQIFA